MFAEAEADPVLTKEAFKPLEDVYKRQAFINIDLEAVGNWAERRGLPYAGYTDLAGKDEVYQLIADCVEQVNADLATDPKL